jgi:hypothetical protein
MDGSRKGPETVKVIDVHTLPGAREAGIGNATVHLDMNTGILTDERGLRPAREVRELVMTHAREVDNTLGINWQTVLTMHEPVRDEADQAA